MVLSFACLCFLIKDTVSLPVDYYRMVLNVLAMLYSLSYSSHFLLYVKREQRKTASGQTTCFKGYIEKCNKYAQLAYLQNC